MRARILFISVVIVGISLTSLAQPGAPLPQTSLLTNGGDLSAQMVEGIDRWLMRETERVVTNRAKLWNVDLSVPVMKPQSPPPYDTELDAALRTNSASSNVGAGFRETQRRHLREIIGAVDPLVAKPRLQFMSEDQRTAEVFRLSAANGFIAYRVRWPVFEEVFGEGLLLEPIDENGRVKSYLPCAVVIPDADQTPEMLAGLRPGVPVGSQLARHLARSGWRVLVPVIVSREDFASGNIRLNRFTNQPHREWIYRQAYEMGRHILGYEVQKVTAGAVALRLTTGAGTVALAGYGEGGFIALHAAALGSPFDSVLVSGSFGPREQLWREPIYRNLFGYLREFGDAELTALVAPRKVIVEYSEPPKVSGPPAPRNGRGGAAPGANTTPEFGEVEFEVERALKFTGGQKGSPFVEFVHGSEGTTVPFGSRKALSLLAASVRLTNAIVFDTTESLTSSISLADVSNRQERTVRDLDTFTQTIFRRSERVRDERIWKTLGSTNDFMSDRPRHREFFWRKVIGKIDAPKLPPNPRSRQIHDKPKWTGYEVMLDVFPDVYAWGYLLVPKDLTPGERRPVVVCQHGLEGVPEDTVVDDPKHKGYGPYKAFAARLAEQGFIVYAPHNPYRGQDKFRVLQRKANPLGLSLFSFIIAQHEVTTDWLASLPFVDSQRIAFYGLSYGGKTAMRVPAVVERYCLSICSADFNEWVQKCVTTESPYSYMFTGEYEMPEWNLGHTFNYAEMASLIVPRPFMVERGHDDGVAPDPWVAYEYAKIRRMYDKLGIGDRTEIEFFNGPHTINGMGTFQFLHRHLNWPQPKP
jgi:dienelactone hydrolase